MRDRRQLWFLQVEPMQLDDGRLDEGSKRECLVMRIGMSQMRNSSVLKNGWGRTSHQIFLALSMQLVRISRLT